MCSQVLWNGNNSAVKSTVQGSPEPPVTPGCLCQMWCGGPKKYERMRACYCFTWTRIRRGTFITVAVYSFVVTASKVPTTKRTHPILALFISHLNCKMQVNLNLNMFCLVLRLTLIPLFAWQDKHMFGVVMHTVKLHRVAQWGSSKRIAWIPSVTRVRVTTDMGKCTEFLLDTREDRRYRQ